MLDSSEQNRASRIRDSKFIDEVDSLIKPLPVKQPAVLSLNPKSVRNSKDISQINADRRSSYIDNQVDPLAIIYQLNQREMTKKAEKQRNFKLNLAIFMSSRLIDFIIIGLVGIFLCISLVNFSFTSNPLNSLLAKDADSNTDVALTLFIVSIIEMIILCTFLVEIILKSIAFRVSVYFKDKWLIFDAFIIALSIIMLLLDWELQDAQFQTVSKVIRGVFRFLRLFLVFRKFNQVKKISNIGSRYHVRSPIEKILEIFNSMLTEFDDISITRELKWCIDKISSNTLYEPLIEAGRDTKDASQWLESMALKRDISIKDRKKGSIAPLSLDLVNPIKRSQIKLDLPSKVSLLFYDELGTLSINSFKLYEEHKQMILPYLLGHLFDFHNLYHKLNIKPDLLRSFGEKVASGYLNNPYHNVVHAFDVTQTLNFFLTTCNFQEIAQLGSLDTLILIVGAAIHDYDHPGQNNPYQINARTDLAITYNDKSPLENHHVSSAFVLLQDKQYNILENLTKEDMNIFRERMIPLILATDMINHFQDLSRLKVRLATSDFDPIDKDKVLCMEALLHAADISNPLKPFSIYEQWASRVLDEFWGQGDLERLDNLPISYLCDRYTTNKAKSQIGFIDFVVLPFYDTIKQFLPIISQHMQNFEDNKIIWKDQIDFYEQELKTLTEARNQEVSVFSK